MRIALILFVLTTLIGCEQCHHDTRPIIINPPSRHDHHDYHHDHHRQSKPHIDIHID